MFGEHRANPKGVLNVDLTKKAAFTEMEYNADGVVKLGIFAGELFARNTVVHGLASGGGKV